MGPEAKKRKLGAASGSAAGPAKRAKNGASFKAGAKGKKKASGKSKGSQKTGKQVPRKVVDIGALSWENVGDENEFGALQVIRNVDVVRTGNNVAFTVADGETEPKKETESAERGQKSVAPTDEAFEGFGDDAEEQPSEDDAPEDDADQTPNEESEDEIKAKKTTTADKPGKKNKKQQSSSDDDLKQTSFSALQNMADVEEAEAEADVDVSAWSKLNVSPAVTSAIASLKFANPTLIQQRCIPKIAAGEDVIGKAQTGSGKTLAFGIPVVEKWLAMQEDKEEKEGPLAVVLSPTRELAKQLGDHLTALCDGLSTASRPYVCVVTGGLSIQKQQRQLEKADIVIGTPGRLWEVLEGDVKLQDGFTKIRFLVVDEADRLLKTGQFKEVEDILGVLDKKAPDADDEESEDEADDGGEARQTLVFSATFDRELQTKLAGKRKMNANKDEDSMEYLMKCLKFRRQPKFIDVNPVSQMADGLKEGLVECGAMAKDLYLYSVLVLNPNRRSLVFTNSISAVRRLQPLLSNLNQTALPLHSQMIQKARLRSLERFTASKNSILVATDVAARGLDIKGVDQVIHYHVPRAADTYIHRSGRTARGGSTGVSIMLCAPDEVIPTRRLSAKVHAQQGRKLSQMIQTVDINRTVLQRLKPRVDLAKKLADAVIAKEKSHGDDAWLKSAAEDLGVDFDADDFEKAEKQMGKQGRGGGRKKKEKEASGLSKKEMQVLRAQLREEMSQRVNLGVSEKYISGGRVDVNKLLRERENNTSGGIFLGAEGLGLDL